MGTNRTYIQAIENNFTQKVLQTKMRFIIHFCQNVYAGNTRALEKKMFKNVKKLVSKNAFIVPVANYEENINHILRKLKQEYENLRKRKA